MSSFRDLSLKSKLMLIIMATSSLAVLTASLAVMVNDVLNFRQGARQELRALADVIGNNSRAALTFNDRPAALETLSAVQANPHILGAFILTGNNEVFASYGSGAAAGSRLKIPAVEAGVPRRVDGETLSELLREADSLWVWDYAISEIRLDSDVIGRVFIQSDPEELYSRVKWLLSVMTFVMAGVFILVYFLSAKLQKIISGPIGSLSRVMKLVSDEKTYSVRAGKQGNDEVGVLIDGFNEMLAQIEKRDEELGTYQKFLEAEVSKRTAASDEWRKTFDSTKDAIFMLDEQDRVVKANVSAAGYLNVSFGEIIGASVHHLFERGGLPSPAGPLSAAGRDGRHAEEELRAPEGNRWFIVSVDPITAVKEGRSGAVLILRDTTDRREAEASQAELQTQLIQIQKMDSIGRLAGGIAHDFNNILSAIIGFSHVALTKLPEEHPAAESVRIIYESGERAAALTRQLLAFSRKQVLDMRALNLNDVIENMVKMLRRVIGENMVLKLDLQKPLGNILADTAQMEQVIMNLVVNARDAMPSGGEVSVSTKSLRAGEDGAPDMLPGLYVCFSVTDTGVGMSREVQERIFEPFFTTKGLGKGTGLGLSTVYGIVKQHSGQIAVSSEEGRGTGFKLYFPVTDREVERVLDRRQPAMVRGTETILIVDDEPSIRKLLAETLGPLGYRLLEASSGEEALKVSEAHGGPIELVVTDVVMPGMNGVRLAGELRKGRPQIRVVFISGYTDNAIITEDLADSGMELIAKPLSPSVVAKKVREALDSKTQPGQRNFTVPDLFGMRILYADDDGANQMLVRKYLEPLGCVPEVCDNGLQALEKFKAGAYDLVLMDMQMPVMDGLAATRAIRQWEAEQGLPASPVIALTGLAGKAEQQACLDAGCTSHLAKPLRKKELLAAVGVHAARRSATANDGLPAGGAGKIKVCVDGDLRDLVPDYLRGRREDVAALYKALEEKQYEAIRILGHSMKGSGGGYGFDGISGLGGEIEEAAKRGDSEAAKKSIQELCAYLDGVEVSYE